MGMLNLMAATTGGLLWNIWFYAKFVVLGVMAICAIFLICVILFQPGNSSGVSALGGQTETFLGKNKSKTFEHKMRLLTIISSVVFAVLCILFAVMMHVVG